MKYFLLFIIIYSCSQNNIKEVFFDKIRDVNIERPEGHEDFFLSQVTTINANEFLVVKLNQKNMLDVFDLKKSTTINSIKIPSKRNFKSFNFINADSIYFKPQYSGSLFLYHQGIIDTIINAENPDFMMKYLSGNNVGPIFDLFSSTVGSFIIKDNKFYFSNMVDPSRSIREQKPLIIYKNPHSNLTIEADIGVFPESMIKPNKSLSPFDLTFSYTLNDNNQTICSYMADHNLYIYEPNGKVKKINCKSVFFDDLPEFISKEDTYKPEIIEKRQNENFSYVGVFFDKFRKLYYRVVVHPNPNLGKTLFDKNAFNYSIMILNDKFEIKGEVMFNNKDYLGNKIHIVKEGILLKKPDDLSGFSRFSIFEPKF